MSIENASLNLSLNWPPIYRRFLAGGMERFRLARASLVLLLAHATILLLAVPLVGTGRDCHIRPLWLGLVLAATLQAVLLAAIAARWLGNRAGLLAGLLQLTVACLLPGPAALPDALFCLTFSVAMGAFMVAQVPGRAALADRPPLRWMFFSAAAIACILAGAASVALILAACVCQWLASQDRRGARYLRDPIGLGIFGLTTVAWFVAAWWANRPTTGLLDWGFFAAAAGHTAATWGTATVRAGRVCTPGGARPSRLACEMDTMPRPSGVFLLVGAWGRWHCCLWGCFAWTSNSGPCCRRWPSSAPWGWRACCGAYGVAYGANNASTARSICSGAGGSSRAEGLPQAAFAVVQFQTGDASLDLKGLHRFRAGAVAADQVGEIRMHPLEKGQHGRLFLGLVETHRDHLQPTTAQPGLQRRRSAGTV